MSTWHQSWAYFRISKHFPRAPIHLHIRIRPDLDFTASCVSLLRSDCGAGLRRMLSRTLRVPGEGRVVGIWENADYCCRKMDRARRGSGCPLCGEEEENRTRTTVATLSEQALGQAPCLRIPDSSVLKGFHRLTQASVPLCKSRRSTKESVSRPPWINVQMLDPACSYCQDRMPRGSPLQGDGIGIW